MYDNQLLFQAFKAEGDKVQSAGEKKSEACDADAVEKLAEKTKKMDVKAAASNLQFSFPCDKFHENIL